jgi:hypothetical protein
LLAVEAAGVDLSNVAPFSAALLEGISADLAVLDSAVSVTLSAFPVTTSNRLKHGALDVLHVSIITVLHPRSPVWRSAGLIAALLLK